MTLKHVTIERLDALIAQIQDNPHAVVDLNNRDFEHLRRLEKVDALLRKYGSKEKVVNMIMNDGEFSITSKTTAYKYIEEAMYVYNSRTTMNVDYFMSVLFEKEFKNMLRASGAGRFREVSMSIANMVKILSHFRKDDSLRAEDLEKQNFTLVVNVGKEAAHRIDLKEFHSMSIQERESILSTIEAEELTPDMVQFIEHEERGEE